MIAPKLYKTGYSAKCLKKTTWGAMIMPKLIDLSRSIKPRPEKSFALSNSRVILDIRRRTQTHRVAKEGRSSRGSKPLESMARHS